MVSQSFVLPRKFFQYFLTGITNLISYPLNLLPLSRMLNEPINDINRAVRLEKPPSITLARLIVRVRKFLIRFLLFFNAMPYISPTPLGDICSTMLPTCPFFFRHLQSLSP